MSSSRLAWGTWLRDTLGWDVAEYFNEEARKLIFDWCILNKLLEANIGEINLYDYSFAMAPMYKAIESILWKLAGDLGLKTEKVTLGQFFDNEHIKQNFDSIKEKVTDKGKQKLIKQELSEIRVFLTRYRHNPAHTGFRFPNLDSEKLAANSALHNIKCLVEDLLAVQVIKLPKKKKNEDFEINLDNIPF